MPRKLSLRTIVIGGVAAGLLIPMSLGTVYAMKAQRQRLYDEAGAAHSRATNVLALGVSKALWDLSPESAVPLVDSILEDSRIVAVQVFDGQGNIFHEKKFAERQLGEVLNLEIPIKNGEEAIGKAKVAFSMASAESQIRNKMIEALLLSAAQAIVCISILVLLINRRLLKPINLLKNQAGQIAQKSLEQPFVWQSNDEIGELGTSLETTRTALKGLFAELEARNVELASINNNLESIVAERTATIKMILNHVKSGFILVDRKLVILDGYTRSCETLLDTKGLTGKSFCSVLQMNADRSHYFTNCMDQVFDDFLPEDISLAQIPKRFKIGNHSISVEGSTIHDAKGQIDKILFTIVDITALEQVEAENKSNRAVVRIMQNISAFHDFVRESNSRIVQALTALQSGNDPIVRRELHTLKGNSAAFGLDGISTLIHHIEDQSWISNENLSAIELEFRSFLDQNFEMFKMRFGEESDRRFSIDSHDIDQLIDTTKDASSSEALKSAVRSWIKAIQKVPIAEVLGPIEGYIAKIAHERNRLLNFKIEGGELKVDRDEVKDIAQNLIHLIRNAVDHGIEPPEERENKSATGSIILSFEETPNNLVITLKDDGRGIDTQRVRQKAVAMKIISQQKADAMSESEALQLIFSDGLSTASSVSDVSGRGVGMKAIEDAVKIRNGSIEISSELGKGTTFRIALPDLKTHSTKMAA